MRGHRAEAGNENDSNTNPICNPHENSTHKS